MASDLAGKKASRETSNFPLEKLSLAWLQHEVDLQYASANLSLLGFTVSDDQNAVRFIAEFIPIELRPGTSKDLSDRIVEAYTTFKVLRQMTTLYLFHQEFVGHFSDLSLADLQAFILDTFSQNRKYHNDIKAYFAKIFGLSYDGNLIVDMFAQYTSEVVETSKIIEARPSERLAWLLEKIADDLSKNVFPERGEVTKNFEKLFNTSFYYAALNKYGEGTKFTEYLAIILGLKEDNGE